MTIRNICVTNMDFLGMLMVTATASIFVEKRISKVYLSDIELDTPPLAWLAYSLFFTKVLQCFRSEL